MYVIKRVDQGGGYVAKFGSAHAYTRNIRSMQRFPTKEAAQAHCCSNEIVIQLDEIVR